MEKIEGGHDPKAGLVEADNLRSEEWEEEERGGEDGDGERMGTGESWDNSGLISCSICAS